MKIASHVAGDASATSPLTKQIPGDIFFGVKTLTIECPDRLYQQITKLVEAGWFKSPEEGALEALRRYLSGHSTELQEQQILSDVEWGLHGRD